MPIYEYACEKCGAKFEVTQKITASPLKRHNGPSKCGGKLRKLMSSNAFHLKGTGWYKTDYADKDKEKKNKREKTAKKEAKTDEKKPESATGEKSSSESTSSGKEKVAAKSDD
ncbi:MAG TPA: zinc ribbon domain-containing protein [Nitrospirae bacterium]|nr:zinc ribbon domain-containing protein [Nitrospirota bacterium]